MKNITVLAVLLFSLSVVLLTAGCSGAEETPDSEDVIRDIQQNNNQSGAQPVPEELRRRGGNTPPRGPGVKGSD